MAVAARMPEALQVVQARQVGPAHCPMANDLHSPTSALGAALWAALVAGMHRRRGQARRAGLVLAVMELGVVKLLVAEVVVARQEGHLSELVLNLFARLSCL